MGNEGKAINVKDSIKSNKVLIFTLSLRKVTIAIHIRSYRSLEAMIPQQPAEVHRSFSSCYQGTQN